MCSCCKTTYHVDSEKYFLFRASEHLGLTSLTGKQEKNPKNHLDTRFEDFTILLIESNKFKLHLKECFLIKYDKSELNRKI